MKNSAKINQHKQFIHIYNVFIHKQFIQINNVFRLGLTYLNDDICTIRRIRYLLNISLQY